MIPLDREIDEGGCASWVPRPGRPMQDLAAASHLSAFASRCRSETSWRQPLQRAGACARRAMRRARHGLRCERS